MNINLALRKKICYEKIDIKLRMLIRIRALFLKFFFAIHFYGLPSYMYIDICIYRQNGFISSSRLRKTQLLFLYVF